MKHSYLRNFGRGSPKEHFCEIILKLGHWPRRRCRLKVFLFFSFGGHFVQRSRTIFAILEEGHPRNISEIILKLGHWPRRRCHLKVFFYF